MSDTNTPDINAPAPVETKTVMMSRVQVRPEMRQWFSSGVPWLDKALGGKGFKRSQVVYLWGGPGSGKSTTAQMLADGLSKGGVQCLYNVNEEYHEQVRVRCDELGLKGEFYASAETDPKKVTKLAEELMALNPGEPFVLVQDSLQTLNDGKWGDLSNSKTPERCLAHLFEWAKTSGATVLVIGHGTKGNVFAGAQKLKHMVDTFGGIVVDRKEKSETFGMRLLQFEKNRMGGVCDPVVLDMDRLKGGRLYDVGDAFDRELGD